MLVRIIDYNHHITGDSMDPAIARHAAACPLRQLT